jgi:hypothetical protein
LELDSESDKEEKNDTIVLDDSDDAPKPSTSTLKAGKFKSLKKKK